MIRFGKATQPQQLEITVSNRTVFRLIAITLVSIIFFAALGKAASALLLIFTALFLALALNAPVHWIAERIPGKRKGSRKLGTAVSFLIVIALLFGFLASIVPPLVVQTTDFIDNAPGLLQDLRNQDTALGRFVQENNLGGQVDKLSSQLSERLNDIGGAAFSTVTKIGSSIFATLTVLVLTFMMLIEGPAWMKFGREFVPARRQKHIDGLLHDMYGVIRGYVNGQVLLAAIAALVIVVPLILLDVSYPIALMVIVFICGLIPMVGHTIGAAIVSAVALFQSPYTALAVLAIYFLYQQIENYVIQPRVQGNATNMSPLLVFSSVLIGVSFGGLFGGLVAIPVAGCIRILVLDYLHHKQIITKKQSTQLV